MIKKTEMAKSTQKLTQVDMSLKKNTSVKIPIIQKYKGLIEHHIVSPSKFTVKALKGMPHKVETLSDRRYSLPVI